jgi:transposase-like protein
MKERKERKNYTSQEKVAIIRKHLIEHAAVSEICEQHHIQPTQFYRWQQEFFENGALAFERKKDGSSQADKQRIEYLESKLSQKNEVLSELMEEHVKLKKTLGVR